jgi:hypothetical protein
VLTQCVEKIVRNLTALPAPITPAAIKIRSARSGIARQKDAKSVNVHLHLPVKIKTYVLRPVSILAVVHSVIRLTVLFAVTTQLALKAMYARKRNVPEVVAR